MLKKLRVKFIAVTLSVTALVLLTIIGFINIHNYNDIVANADLTLRMLQKGFRHDSLRINSRPKGRQSRRRPRAK